MSQKHLKTMCKCLSVKSYELYKLSIRHSSFSKELKLSEVIPVYKKLDLLQKENYRPVSFLPHVSKVFERTIHKQLTNCMADKLAHSITGFCESRGTQNS